MHKYIQMIGRWLIQHEFMNSMSQLIEQRNRLPYYHGNKLTMQFAKEYIFTAIFYDFYLLCTFTIFSGNYFIFEKCYLTSSFLFWRFFLLKNFVVFFHSIFCFLHHLVFTLFRYSVVFVSTNNVCLNMFLYCSLLHSERKRDEMHREAFFPCTDSYSMTLKQTKLYTERKMKI